jgi:hypothetical protein
VSVTERREYQRRERELLAACGVEFDEPTCRECGCSDSLGCEEGCWWAQDDLCSACAAEVEETAAVEQRGEAR